MSDLQGFQNLFLISLSSGQVIKNLAVALICGFIISRFYRWTTTRLGNSRTFVAALITLSIITAVVIMVIGNNLARAFGLVGAMSIIRFRTAIKDVQDIVFIFFSLAIGMAAGIGQSTIAFIGTIFVCLVMMGIKQIQSSGHRMREYLFQFSYTPSEDNEPPYLPIFKKYCKRHNLINMKSYGEEGQLELAFYIQLRDPEKKSSLVRDLGQIKGVQNVNLFYNEESP